MLKVLWFVNKPLPAVTHRLALPDRHHACWLDGLEIAVRNSPDVRLAVVSGGVHPFLPFEEGGVTYYDSGSREPASRPARMARRWRQAVHPRDDLSGYVAAIKDFDPDVVHFHGTESAYGLLCPRIPMPSVISLQGLLSVYERMVLRGIDTSFMRCISPSLLVRGGGFVHGTLTIKRAAKRERRIISGCRNFIGRTSFDEYVVRALNPSCRYYPSDYRIVRPEFFSREWSLEGCNDLVVYATAGDYVRKGVGTLLESVSLLKRFALPDVSLRIGGSLGSPEEGGRAVLHRIQKLGLEKNVTLLGVLDARSIAEELRSARAFVLASHADNSPNTLAEAMVVGVPCVATAVGGVPSMVREGIEGLLIQDGDPYALAGALLRVMSDNDIASELGRRARETARLRHDPQQILQHLLGIYRELAAGDGTVPAASVSTD